MRKGGPNAIFTTNNWEKWSEEEGKKGSTLPLAALPNLSSIQRNDI